MAAAAGSASGTLACGGSATQHHSPNACMCAPSRQAPPATRSPCAHVSLLSQSVAARGSAHMCRQAVAATYSQSVSKPPDNMRLVSAVCSRTLGTPSGTSSRRLHTIGTSLNSSSRQPHAPSIRPWRLGALAAFPSSCSPAHAPSSTRQTGGASEAGGGCVCIHLLTRPIRHGSDAVCSTSMRETPTLYLGTAN